MDKVENSSRGPPHARTKEPKLSSYRGNGRFGSGCAGGHHHIFCFSLDAAMFQRFIAIVDTSVMSLSEIRVHEVQALNLTLLVGFPRRPQH